MMIFYSFLGIISLCYTLFQPFIMFVWLTFTFIFSMFRSINSNVNTNTDLLLTKIIMMNNPRIKFMNYMKLILKN